MIHVPYITHAELNVFILLYHILIRCILSFGQWKAWTKAYYTEAKWCNSGYRPSYKEYMDIARVTVGFPTIPISGLMGLGEVVTREALLWLRSRPPIVVSCSYLCRIIDDLQEPYKVYINISPTFSCLLYKMDY